MEPRLKSSTQWSPFPIELCDQICEVFTDRFADEYDLRGFHFISEGQIYQAEILIRVGLTNPKQLRQHNFELSVPFDPEKSKAKELIEKSLDNIAPQFIELLEEDFDDHEFTREWQALEKPSIPGCHMRYSTINTDLEKQADILLEEFEKKLVYGESDPTSQPDPLH